jgi:hypothetical protein
MSMVVQVLSLVIQLLPLILQVMQIVEKQYGFGTGAQKKEAVVGTVVDIVKEAPDVDLPPTAIPFLETAVGIAVDRQVAAMNATGKFKQPEQ